MFSRIFGIPVALCFGHSKTPDMPANPDPTPTPTPAAQPGEVAASAESKRAKTDAMKYGAMGTVRNKGGAQGISGTGADLSSPEAQAGTKKTIGS